jgi:hypothetical protein
MGNIFSSSNKKRSANIYEPFVNQPVNQSENSINLLEQIQKIQDIQLLTEKNSLLEEEIKILKRELDVRTSRIDTSIQIKYNELLNSITYYNEKNNEKINIITKDMENLLNNDKILLDKLIEKNIVSTIQET